MATLKIRMVIGMIAMLIGGLSLNAVAQNNANMPAQQKKNCRIAKNGATVNFTVAGKIPAGGPRMTSPSWTTARSGNLLTASPRR